MKHTKLVLAGVTLMACSASVIAADAQLNFSGKIILPTCTVNSQSATQNIDLASIKITDFTATTANAKAFQIDLENCVAGTNVSMTVNGTTDTVASVLKNSASAAGAATNVGVQLLRAATAGDTTGSPITIGSAQVIGAVDSTNTMSIPMVAQFYKLGTLTAGSVEASATVNFTYN